MATQMLPDHHQEMLDAVDPRTEPVLRSLAVDQAGAYAEEVRLLRRKVATLEAALAAAHAARLDDQRCGCHHQRRPVDIVPVPPGSATYGYAASEFEPALTPAVVPVRTTESGHQSADAPLGVGVFAATGDSQNPGAATDEVPLGGASAFGDAWSDDGSTFEERFAARAFFQVSTIDEPSREWLLSADSR